MKLHQLLRFIPTGVYIIIFNLNGQEVVRVRTKESLNVDLYDVDILDIKTGWVSFTDKDTALYITVQM